MHRVHHGVYAVGHTKLSKHGECLAAVLAVGPGSLLSYWSAGWLWGVIRTSPKPFHVTAPGPRRLRDRPPVRVHRARNLVAEDHALVDGVPVTSLARTLLDLAEVLRGDRLARALEQAEALRDEDGLRLFDFYAVVAVTERSRGHRGAKPLRKAMALYRPQSTIRSEPERRFHEILAGAGLPQAHANYVVLGCEVDAYWPELAFGVEVDAYATHGSRRSFEVDRERDAELAAAGITIVRITEHRIEHDPAGVAAQVAALLGARRAAAPRRPASPPSPV